MPKGSSQQVTGFLRSRVMLRLSFSLECFGIFAPLVRGHGGHVRLVRLRGIAWVVGLRSRGSPGAGRCPRRRLGQRESSHAAGSSRPGSYPGPGGSGSTSVGPRAGCREAPEHCGEGDSDRPGHRGGGSRSWTSHPESPRVDSRGDRGDPEEHCEPPWDHGQPSGSPGHPRGLPAAA